MESLLLWVGRLAGVAGVSLLVFSVVARLGGRYFVAGFQTGTLLQVAIATMVLGCLCYVATLAERSRR